LQLKITKKITILHRKNDFAKRSTILLDTGLKIIYVGPYQINLIGTLKIISNFVKNVDILATSLRVL